MVSFTLKTQAFKDKFDCTSHGGMREGHNWYARKRTVDNFFSKRLAVKQILEYENKNYLHKILSLENEVT